jgi:hypothetical protein
MEGYVYILVNSSLPNLVKIGRTTKEPNIRAAELSSTGTPGRFIVAYSVLVDNCIEVESEMHSIFSKKRHTNDREFFELDSPSAIDKLNEITKDRKVSELASTETSESMFATLYLIKVHKHKEIYRVGLINREITYLSDGEFESMVNDLYHHLDSKNLYNCEILKSIEFSDIDNEAINAMRSLIDNNLNRLQLVYKSILYLDKFDERTFYFRNASVRYIDRLFDSTLTLLQPVANSSKSRFLKKIELANQLENKKIVDTKLLRIDTIKKLGI